jgi:hypothetical protein
MTVLAETCQKLAKFPSLRDYGPEFVKTEHYLHEALDYLLYATHSGNPIDYHHLFVYPFNVPSDVFIFYFTVCENIQEISQKWLHTRVQAIVPCIPGEHEKQNTIYMKH